MSKGYLDILEPDLRQMVEQAAEVSDRLSEERDQVKETGGSLSSYAELRWLRSNFDAKLAGMLADREMERRQGLLHEEHPGLPGAEEAVLHLCARMWPEAVRLHLADDLLEITARIEQGRSWVQRDFDRGLRDGWSYRGEDRALMKRVRTWTRGLDRLTTNTRGNSASRGLLRWMRSR